MNFRAIKGVVIDAGHGGDDPGAVGNGIIEKNLNLEASEYMYNRLKELGIPVKIIRSTDETLSSTDRTKRILNAFGNSSDVIVISNHINAGGATISMW
ncbi:MAG TPA: N-acetylmuramoyl-L-alanine amidase [Bacilli bacterium]|nr:N-acetylmuramoyl-L-alanine amidase [Bacilli bacterium]